MGEGAKVPEEQSVLLADNLHGQTTPEVRNYLLKECNTLLWLVPSGCIDEVQPIDAGHGRRIKVLVGQYLDTWFGHGYNLEKWMSNKLSASERRVLLTRWVATSVAELDAQVEYRFRMFEKTGTAMRADGSGDDRINLEGISWAYTFVDVEDDDSPDEVDQSGDGSPDEDTHDSSDDDDEEEAEQGTQDPLAQLDDDDDLSPKETSLGMEIPSGFCLQMSPPQALDESLVKRGVLVRLGLGWLGGVITRTPPTSASYRVKLKADQSDSVKLALEDYSTDEPARIGAWVLLEAKSQDGVRRSGRTLTPNVRNMNISA